MYTSRQVRVTDTVLVAHSAVDKKKVYFFRALENLFVHVSVPSLTEVRSPRTSPKQQGTRKKNRQRKPMAVVMQKTNLFVFVLCVGLVGLRCVFSCARPHRPFKRAYGVFKRL